MKIFQAILLFSFSLCFVEAIASLDVAALTKAWPACSLTCVTTTLSKIPESDENLSDLCTNVTLHRNISGCVQRSCNYTEQFKVVTAAQNICKGYPIPDKSGEAYSIILPVTTLALLCIVLHCYSRYTLTRAFGADDTIIIIVGLILVVEAVIHLYNCSANGLGRHYWNVNPLRIPELLKISLAVKVLYVSGVTLVKASILVFYLRIFPSKWFAILDMTILTVNCIAGLLIDCLIILACIPIAGSWDRTISSKCLDIHDLAYANGVISVVLDIIVLVLPIPWILRLKMNWRKKLNLMFVFAIGILACIISIVRLNFLVNFANSADFTWDNFTAYYWSLVELCVATVCACLPAIRGLLAKSVPSIFNFDSSVHSAQYLPSDGNHTAGANLASRSSMYRRSQLQTTGPRYNKRIVSRDDELLNAVDNHVALTAISVKEEFSVEKGDRLQIGKAFGNDYEVGGVYAASIGRATVGSETNLAIQSSRTDAEPRGESLEHGYALEQVVRQDVDIEEIGGMDRHIRRDSWWDHRRIRNAL